MQKINQWRASSKVLFLVVGAVLVLGLGIWYVFMHHDSSKNTQADPTISWKVLDEPSFTIKYPVDWEFVKKGDTVDNEGEALIVSADQFVIRGETPDEGNELKMEQGANNNHLSAGQYAMLNTTQGTDVGHKNFKIKSKDAYTQTTSLNGGPKISRTVVVNGQEAITFTYLASVDKSKIYNQIVQTTQFK
jgi:hypothetical protein